MSFEDGYKELENYFGASGRKIARKMVGMEEPTECNGEDYDFTVETGDFINE